MGRLDGKVALVSGGARAIGVAITRRFLDEGAKVLTGEVLEGGETAGTVALSAP